MDGHANMFKSVTPLGQLKAIMVLAVGAILAPARRTVTAALRVMGLEHDARFQNYHRVLNRARWCTRSAGWILLSFLLRAFAPEGPIVVGLDDTIERRWGRRIKARGIYRDSVRSSHGHFVKASGLRWLSHAFCPRSPGRQSLGAAVSDRAYSLGAVRQECGQAAQDATRLDQADGPPAPALAA